MQITAANSCVHLIMHNDWVSARVHGHCSVCTWFVTTNPFEQVYTVTGCIISKTKLQTCSELSGHDAASIAKQVKYHSADFGAALPQYAMYWLWLLIAVHV